jgi:hypothetical protein
LSVAMTRPTRASAVDDSGGAALISRVMFGGFRSRALGVWCAFGLFWACGGDDKPATGAGGKAGSSGAAGKGAGGNGGSAAGRGGMAGRGGTAGRGGSATVGGQGGEAGETGGKGGTAGKGGSGSGGMAGTVMQAGEAGEGGEGGVPPSGGEVCTTCAATACSDELTRCEASPHCSAWLACVNACDSAACAENCDEDAESAIRLTTRVYQCLCGADCANECGTFDVCDKSCIEGAGPPSSSGGIGTAPALLTDTGLFVQETSTDPWTLAPYVQSFQPEYALWSDGAEKARHIYLPGCATIDTSDMDHWSFPVGTRLWKQFTRDDVRVETRMLWRFGAGVGDWVMATYQWPLPVGSEPPDPELATLVDVAGVMNANGTQHDIPGTGACTNCHGKLSERVLGFSAIQLSHALGGVTFTELADRGILSYVPVRTGYDPPGDATAKSALGYLHSNCGNCHNDTGQATGPTQMHLRLLVGEQTVASTGAWTTARNVPTFNGQFAMDRIEPTQPGQSSVLVRMARNPSIGELLPMPPIGRELPDTNGGIAAVTAWVNSLTP